LNDRKNRLKILIMGNNAVMGGLIVHYLVLTKYLRNAGHEVFIINVNDKNLKQFDDKLIPEIVIPYQPKSFIQKVIKYVKLRNAAKKARSFNPDLFIATGYGHGYAMIASALSKSTFKIFEEVHFEMHEIPLKQKMVNCFDAIAPQTRGMVDNFRSQISTKKPVAYLPCFSKEYKTDHFNPIPSGMETIRLAYFGRLERNKGVRQFIAATAEIFLKKDLYLDIYGKGSESMVLENEINKLNLQNRVKLKGFYQDDDFPQIIGSYHGVVIPSVDTEGLPLILIEAMRFGRPVLCTTIGAMPEVGKININGMIVSGKEPQDLKQNLEFFTERLTKNNFSADNINSIYRNYFSNEAFWGLWKKMLENPKTYFIQN
jgi:glycosyltransferase involved in cell wall biosynthesis